MLCRVALDICILVLMCFLLCRKLLRQILFLLHHLVKIRFEFELWSKVTPKYFASFAGFIVTSFITIDASVDCLWFLVKWTSTYFDFSNWAPCLFFHISASSSIVRSCAAFPSAVGPLV